VLYGLEQHDHKNIKNLQLIQNFACRIVLGLKKYDHIMEGLKSLNWLNVKDILFVNDLLMVDKCIHDQIPSYLHGQIYSAFEASWHKH